MWEKLQISIKKYLPCAFNLDSIFKILCDVCKNEKFLAIFSTSHCTYIYKPIPEKKLYFNLNVWASLLLYVCALAQQCGKEAHTKVWKLIFLLCIQWWCRVTFTRCCRSTAWHILKLHDVKLGVNNSFPFSLFTFSRVCNSQRTHFVLAFFHFSSFFMSKALVTACMFYESKQKVLSQKKWQSRSLKNVCILTFLSAFLSLNSISDKWVKNKWQFSRYYNHFASFFLSMTFYLSIWLPWLGNVKLIY